MKIKKQKIFLNRPIIFFTLFAGVLFFSSLTAYAVKMTSTSFIIQDPIVGTGGGYGSSASFQLISAGNMNLSGIGSSASFQTRYGFLYFASAVTGTITFDIDTATTDSESSTPYSVALGTLSTGSVARSNGSINSIWMDLDTNATSGAVITVTSSSLKSTSVPGDTIPSATATMAAGTANYGLCIASATAGTGTFTKVSPYNGATCVDGAVNTVGIIDTTSRDILNSNSTAITTGRAQIRVNAAISNVTSAHADYADTLTFIATSTF